MGSDFSSYAFSDLLTNIVDNRGKTCPTADDGLPLIATNCVKNDTLYPTFEKIRYVDQKTYDSWFRGHPEPGDIIFICKGAPGSVCWTPDPVNFCIAQDMVAIRPNQDIVDPKFLFALLRYPGTQRQILNMHVGTMIPHFKKGDFRNLYLDIPTDRRIQAAIGEIYFEFCRKIELNRRMNQTLESMARALFKSWFVDFDPVIDNALAAGHGIPEPLAARASARRALGDARKPLPENIRTLFPATFTFDEEMGWIPEGWEALPYGDLLEFENGDRGKNYPKVSQFVETGIPFINAGHLVDGAVDLARVNRISEDTFSNLRSGKVRPGDLLYCLRGSPGRVASVGRMEHGAIASSLVIVRPTKRARTSFVYHTLSGSVGQQMAAELNNGSAQPNVSVTSLSAYPVLAPTVACQDAFASMAEPLLGRVEDYRTASVTLSAVRDTLLPKLLSGDLRIPEAEKLLADSV